MQDEPHLTIADKLPGSNSAALPARRLSIAASVGAALALNLLAIGAFAAVTSRWQTASGAPQHVPRMTVVELNHRPFVQAQPSSDPQPAPVTATPTASPVTVVDVAARVPSLPPDVEASYPVRFYRSGEVERPAEPDSDWNLDAAALDALGAELLVFDIFISRDGEVLSCSVLAPATLTDEARRSVEQRLRETIVRPALLGGMPVASVRRIEVSVLPSEP